MDSIYALAQEWCTSQSDEGFDQLMHFLETLKPEECILVGGRVLHGGPLKGDDACLWHQTFYLVFYLVWHQVFYQSNAIWGLVETWSWGRGLWT